MNHPAVFEGVLDLRRLVTDLVADGRLKQTDANVLLGTTRSREQAMMHPLAYIASQSLEDLKRHGKTLDGDALTSWLAEKARMPVVHIDPLKIDVPKVTRSEEHTSELQSRENLVCRLLLEKK